MPWPTKQRSQIRRASRTVLGKDSKFSSLLQSSGKLVMAQSPKERLMRAREINYHNETKPYINSCQSRAYGGEKEEHFSGL